MALVSSRLVCRSLLQGKTSHKFIDMSENPIMNVYYTNRTVLFWMCFGNETFYSALYLLHFSEGPLSMHFTKYTWWNANFLDVISQSLVTCSFSPTNHLFSFSKFQNRRCFCFFCPVHIRKLNAYCTSWEVVEKSKSNSWWKWACISKHVKAFMSKKCRRLSAHLISVAGLSLYRIAIYLSAPIAAVKTGISLLHLVVASRNLSIIDVNERRIQQSKRAE